jgi:hypothetical protein
MDFPSGTLSATTFKKLPILIPKRKNIIAKITSKSPLLSSVIGTEPLFLPVY